MLANETVETLEFLRSGFRAKYIIDAAQKVASGLITENAIRNMDISQARTVLKSIKGVGPKVAECVLLYGLYRTEAFPVDVWIKRVLEKYYPCGFPEFASQYAGIAQQYLFHYKICRRSLNPQLFKRLYITSYAANNHFVNTLRYGGLL